MLLYHSVTSICTITRVISLARAIEFLSVCAAVDMSFERNHYHEADTRLNLSLSLGNGKWNPWIEFNSIWCWWAKIWMSYNILISCHLYRCRWSFTTSSTFSSIPHFRCSHPSFFIDDTVIRPEYFGHKRQRYKDSGPWTCQIIS